MLGAGFIALKARITDNYSLQPTVQASILQWRNDRGMMTIVQRTSAAEVRQSEIALQSQGAQGAVIKADCAIDMAQED